MEEIWGVLGFIALIILVNYWKGPNAVWGGLTAGIIIGFIIAFIIATKGSDFSFYTVCKSAIVGVLVGFVIELLGKIGDKLKRRP